VQFHDVNVEIRPDEPLLGSTLVNANARKTDDDAPVIVEAEEVNCLGDAWKFKPQCAQQLGVTNALQPQPQVVNVINVSGQGNCIGGC